MKSFVKYIILLIVLLVIGAISYSRFSNFFLENGTKKTTEKAVEKSQNYDDLISLQKQVQENSIEIANLKNLIKEKNITNINSERYSKILITMLMLERNLFLAQKIDVSFDVKMLNEFSQNDPKLYEIFHKIPTEEKIYGVKYFQAHFNELVRVVSRKMYDENEYKLGKFIKNYVMPYVAYVIPSKSHNMNVLYNAESFLQSGDMTTCLQELEKMHFENKEIEEFNDYLEELRKSVILMNAIDEAKMHIQLMLFNAEKDHNVKIS